MTVSALEKKGKEPMFTLQYFADTGVLVLGDGKAVVAKDAAFSANGATELNAASPAAEKEEEEAPVSVTAEAKAEIERFKEMDEAQLEKETNSFDGLIGNFTEKLGDELKSSLKDTLGGFVCAGYCGRYALHFASSSRKSQQNGMTRAVFICFS